MQRFGSAGNTNNLLHLLCGTELKAVAHHRPAPATINKPMTILGAAGHMHLLGRQLKIEANPGTAGREDAPRHPDLGLRQPGRQADRPGPPRRGRQGRVTCKHVQWLRDVLPAFEGPSRKYVVWAEGTTDEMCLGMLQVAFDDESLDQLQQARRRAASRRARTGSPKTTSSTQAVIRCRAWRESSRPAKSRIAPSGTWWVSPIRRASSGRWPPGNQDGGASSGAGLVVPVLVDIVVAGACDDRTVRRNSRGPRRALP